MKDINYFVVVLVAAAFTAWSVADAQAQPVCGAFNPAWKACVVDTDCVIGRDACRSPTGYNSKYLEAATAYATCLAPMVECATPDTASLSSRKPVCKQQQCVSETVPD